MAIGADSRFGDEHGMLRSSVARFAAEHVAPCAEQWESDPPFARELFSTAGGLGFLGLRYEPAFGVVEGFGAERLVLSCFAHTMMERLYSEATGYAAGREVEGKPLSKHQVWRHRLADFRTTIEAARQLTYWACDLIARNDAGAHEVIGMAKLFSCEAVRNLALEAVQIHGGYGYIEEYPVARMYREVGAFTIGAGTSEVMREIVAREERL